MLLESDKVLIIKTKTLYMYVEYLKQTDLKFPILEKTANANPTTNEVK